MNEYSQNWRGIILLYCAAVLVFIFVNPAIDRIQAALFPQVQEQKPVRTKAEARPGPAKPKKSTIPAIPSLWENSLLCVRRERPPVIDAKPNDWNLSTGILQTADYATLVNSASVWHYTSFDDKAFYIFARIRDPYVFNEQKVEDDPSESCFVQVRLRTDQFIAINFWNTKSQNLKLQIHRYVREKPKKKPRVKEFRITADDDGHRLDGIKLGAAAASSIHQDGRGYDVEIAIPWKVLCKDLSKRPRVGTRTQAELSARLSMKTDLGNVVTGTGKPGKLKWMWFVARPPTHRLWPKIRGGKFLPIDGGTQTELPHLNTDKAIFPYRPLYRRIIAPPREDIVIDGELDDWSKNAGISVCQNIKSANAARAWFYPAHDSQNFYLAVLVFEPTPLSGGDQITLHIQSDKTYEVELKATGIFVNGAPLSGGKIAAKRWRNGTGYSLEMQIPWHAICADPKSQIRMSTSISMNPHWVLHGIGDFTQDPNGPIPAQQGAILRFTDSQPAIPMSIPVANDRQVPIAFNEDGQPTIQQRGFRDLSPYAVIHKEVDVIPGTAKIDGKADEWDLSGGVFLCNDMQMLRDAGAYWLHLMYDDKYLYALGRITDHSPQEHCGVGGPWGDDIFTIRVNYGQVGHYHAWKKPPKMDWDIIVQRENPHHTLKKNQLPKEGHGILSAAVKSPDGSGYTLEMAIPWRLIHPKGKRPEPGETCPLDASIRISPKYAIECVGKWPGVAGFWWDNKYWGTAVFREKGNLSPRSCHLANGTVLPVTMQNGKPVVDFSALQPQ